MLTVNLYPLIYGIGRMALVFLSPGPSLKGSQLPFSFPRLLPALLVTILLNVLVEVLVLLIMEEQNMVLLRVLLAVVVDVEVLQVVWMLTL